MFDCCNKIASDDDEVSIVTISLNPNIRYKAGNVYSNSSYRRSKVAADTQKVVRNIE